MLPLNRDGCPKMEDMNFLSIFNRNIKCLKLLKQTFQENIVVMWFMTCGENLSTITWYPKNVNILRCCQMVESELDLFALKFYKYQRSQVKQRCRCRLLISKSSNVDRHQLRRIQFSEPVHLFRLFCLEENDSINLLHFLAIPLDSHTLQHLLHIKSRSIKRVVWESESNMCLQLSIINTIVGMRTFLHVSLYYPSFCIVHRYTADSVFTFKVNETNRKIIQSRRVTWRSRTFL